MKKLLALVLSSIMIFAMTACGSSYKDGTYSAVEDAFSETGWKGNIEVTVSGGKITAVNWDAVNEDGETKKEQGDAYGMREASEIGKEWDEQAKAVEDELIKTQDPKKLKMDDKGYADGITGASMNISGFVNLAEDALSQAK